MTGEQAWPPILISAAIPRHFPLVRKMPYPFLMKFWESQTFRPLRHAPSFRHEFVIGPMCDSALFLQKARLYYCIRCNWRFLVCETTVVVLDGDGHPLTGPDSSTRFATFAEGPCPALAELESRYPLEAAVVNLKPGRKSDERTTMATCNILVGPGRARPLFRVFSRLRENLGRQS
jgi:hypothetical protein